MGFQHLSDVERSLMASIGSNTKWAFIDDPAKATAPARAAFEARFLALVDPDNQLDPAERAKRAERARRAYFQQLAFKSARARRRTSEDSSAA